MREEGVGPSKLEGTASLQHFRLDPDRGSRVVAQRIEGEQRRTNGDPVQDGGGGAKIAQRDEGNGVVDS